MIVAEQRKILVSFCLARCAPLPALPGIAGCEAFYSARTNMWEGLVPRMRNVLGGLLAGQSWSALSCLDGKTEGSNGCIMTPAVSPSDSMSAVVCVEIHPLQRSRDHRAP